MKLNIVREIRNLRISLLVIDGNTLAMVGKINGLCSTHIRIIFYEQIRKFRKFNHDTKGMVNANVYLWNLKQIQRHRSFITVFKEYAQCRIVALHTINNLK